MSSHAKPVDIMITRRPIDENDLEFLCAVYTTTREDIAQLPWSDEQKAELCRHQFLAQHTHYEQFFANAAFEIVLVDDEPVGRVYVDRTKDEIRVIDISILPRHRGRGIGGVVMNEILNEAAQQGLPVRLRVEPNNPARRWYESLGFQKIADEQVNWHMERAADAKSKA